MSALCVLFTLALSSSLCVLACVCTIRCCRNTNKLDERVGERGLVGHNLMYSVCVSPRERKGERNYRAEKEERHAALVAGTRSETQVMRNPILTVCCAPTHPLPPLTGTLWTQPFLRIAWGEPHLTTASQGNPQMRKKRIHFYSGFPTILEFLCFFVFFSDLFIYWWGNSLLKYICLV